MQVKFKDCVSIIRCNLIRFDQGIYYNTKIATAWSYWSNQIIRLRLMYYKRQKIYSYIIS